MAGERTEFQYRSGPGIRIIALTAGSFWRRLRRCSCWPRPCKAAYPHLDVRNMQAGRFAKFLEIPPEAARLDAVVELERGENGEVCARLLTRTQLKTMTRMTTHCELTFAAGAAHDKDSGKSDDGPLAPVPGWKYPPSRCTGIWSPLDRPTAPCRIGFSSMRSPPGAPCGLPTWSNQQPGSARFALSARRGHACGLRPWPAAGRFRPLSGGFCRQGSIAKPTRAGERYRTQVQLQSRTAEELVYNLRIFDQTEQVRETIRGLRMRDVSGGRIRPPVWIKETLKGTNSGAQPS